MKEGEILCDPKPPRPNRSNHYYRAIRLRSYSEDKRLRNVLAGYLISCCDCHCGLEITVVSRSIPLGVSQETNFFLCESMGEFDIMAQ
jgi:hypothetical protein